jgi:hypothetical protein
MTDIVDESEAPSAVGHRPSEIKAKLSRLARVVVVEQFPLTTALIVAVTGLGTYDLVAWNVVGLDSLSKFIDVVFKVLAVVIGALWTLNRHLVSRTDAPQIRVDHDVKVVRANPSRTAASGALLLYRFDVVNTGKTLIRPLEQVLQIHALEPAHGEVTYRQLVRWPAAGTHPSGGIEPGSWSAISSAIAVDASILAVHAHLELRLGPVRLWTWHKTFDVSQGVSANPA